MVLKAAGGGTLLGGGPGLGKALESGTGQAAHSDQGPEDGWERGESLREVSGC